MNLDQLAWGTGLALVALAIVVPNDRMKRTKAPKTQDRTQPSARGMVVGIAVGAGVIGVSIVFRRKFPNLGWLVPWVYFGIMVSALVILLRKVIWVFVKSALTGQFPLVIRKIANGQLDVKCPHCSFRVAVTAGQTGETAFECPQCGQKATWASELKP